MQSDILYLLIPIFVGLLIVKLIFWYASLDDSYDADDIRQSAQNHDTDDIRQSAQNHDTEYSSHYNQTSAELLDSQAWADFRQHIFRIRGNIRQSAQNHDTEYSSHYNQTYAELLHSQEWADFRQHIFRIRGNVCEWCHNPYAKPLQVHHKYYLKYRGQRYLPWQYSPNDVMVVCRHCHRVIHQKYTIKTYARHPSMFGY